MRAAQISSGRCQVPRALRRAAGAGLIDAVTAAPFTLFKFADLHTVKEVRAQRNPFLNTVQGGRLRWAHAT